MRGVLFVAGISLTLCVVLLLAGCGKGDQGQAMAGPQTTCPVMGNPIDKKYYVDYQGKRVYFCCPSCPAKFKGDPEKYIKVMKDQGVVLEDAPEDHSGHEH